MSKSKARKLAEFLRNLTDDSKIGTSAVEQDKIVTTRGDLESKANDTESLVSSAAVTSYIGNKLEDYIQETHDINLTFTGDVTGFGTITDMSHTSIGLTLDAETLPDQAGYAGKFLTTNGTVASWATVDTSNGDTAFSWGNHSTQGYATQTYVNNAVSNLVDSAPTTLDTLNELANALGDDPNFATTVSNSIGTKWTQDNTKISNWDTAYTYSQVGHLPLTGGTLTGELKLQGSAPQLKFEDTDNDDYWIHVNSGRFYILPDRDSSGAWETPYPLEILADSNSFKIYGNEAITTGNIGSQSVSYASSSGSATHLPTRYIGGQQTNPQTYFGQSVGLKVAMTGYPNVWSDTLWINGYAGSDVKNMCALHTARNGQPRMWISSQLCDGTSYGTAYEFWTSYNDGSGSGLDADLLDGVHGSSFLRSDATDYIGGNLMLRADIVGDDDGYRDHGVYGNYDSYRIDHIWSMGTPYRINANGSSFGNLYGLAYTFSNRVYTSNAMAGGHQMVWCQNGNPRAAMGDGIWTSGTVRAASYVYNSDKAFKTDIAPLENSLDKVLQLQGVSYTLKKDGQKSIGFIAQEVEEILPELVEGEEGNKGIHYGQVVSLLVEAIKEQQKQIEELKDGLK